MTDKYRIVDTTLRDGEQSAGIAFGIKEKVSIAKFLDKMGVYQIEAGIPAMGGQEAKSVAKVASLGLKSKISAWNRLNVEDIRLSMECDVSIIHISAPASDIQIKSKLNKQHSWVVEKLKECISAAKDKGFEVTIGLEDASRADKNFLIELCKLAEKEGASRVRYADTVGILHRKKIFEEMKLLKETISINFEIHAHNDLGMAVSNSIAAVEAGALYVDTTINGIGERAGNCDFKKFIIAANECFNTFGKYRNEENLKLSENKIKNLIKCKF